MEEDDNTNSSTANTKVFNKVTHVIFDLDGLLLDTESVYKQVVTDMAKEYDRIYTDEIRLKLLGTPEKVAADIAIREMDLPVTVDNFVQEQRRRSKFKFLADACPFMPGAERLVLHFYNNNVPMAVATSSTKESFDLKTAEYKDLFSLFHHIVTGGSDADVKHGKPNPDIFLVCASRFPDKPKPEKCLVFEDAPNGVTAAISAGMQCVMVPDPETVPELTKHATQVLKTLEQVKPELYGLPAFNVV